MNYRIEQDYLGNIEIPENAYYGINTQRALLNFPLSNYSLQNRIYRALALVKKAATLTNYELGYLEKDTAFAVCKACDEIAAGKFADSLRTNAMQGGAGTSANMNINEVLANRALEILGFEKGEYNIIHPIEQINLHQSANDVFPTAMKIAAIYELKDLAEAYNVLYDAFRDKEKEFGSILTIAKTEFQDAVPMTLGAVFGAFADVISRDRRRIASSIERLKVVNMGGTAVGTGLTAPKEYIKTITDKLKVMTGLALQQSENLIDCTSNYDTVAEVLGNMATLATTLQKIALDIRFLHYQEEIQLQDLQVGSSITPGKINPVISEAMVAVALKVKANSSMVAELCSLGTLQMNEYLPIMAYTLINTLELLRNTAVIAAKNIEQILPKRDVCKSKVENSRVIITAFLPYIGFEKAEELLREYAESPDEITLKEFLKRKLGEKLVNRGLSIGNIMGRK